jgi:hypothetical protein
VERDARWLEAELAWALLELAGSPRAKFVSAEMGPASQPAGGVGLGVVGTGRVEAGKYCFG